MDDLEKQIRKTFESGPEGAPAPDDLRRRMIANAVRTPRTPPGRARRRPWVAWTPVPRLAPAIAALAVIAIVGGLYLGGRSASTPRPVPSGTHATAYPMTFGLLPAPGLQAPQGVGGGFGESPAVIPYFGPAQLSWTGQPPPAPAAGTVYAFKLPAPAQADALAARLGARPAPNSPGATARLYRGPGSYQLIVIFDTWPEPQPVYRLDQAPGPTAAQPPDQAQARTAAEAELQRLGLTPQWPSDVSVGAWGIPANHWSQVFLQRRVAVNASLQAGLVNSLGEPDGVSVIVDGGGRTVDLSGPLYMGGEATDVYPLRSAKDAALAALAAPPITSAALPDGSVPAVALTRATLVYAIAHDGAGQAYLEPAYLFSGTFVKDGITFEKRVLVPALAASAIRT